MMKKIQILILLILIPYFGISQNEFLADLPIRGATEGIGISDIEEIWIATKTGNTYHTDGINELWHFGPLGSKNEMDFSSGTYDRINFLSKDILLISGYIHGKNSNKDLVLRSTDRGKTWKEIKFGYGSWIDAFYTDGNGKIWMSGSSQFIYYSNNYGKTWEQFDKVEKKGNLRFSTIHFSSDNSIGLFGSFWNVIYKTNDNCKTWQKLPTPLSQKKYTRISKKDRPDIRKIRILNNFIIVNQQGKIYFTNSDNINWKLLPNIVDFEITKSNELFTINKDLSIELLDNDLQSIWKSNRKIDKFPIDIQTKNGSLFAFTYNHIYKINKEQFISSELLTDEVPIREPYLKVNYKNQEIGFSRNNVLKFSKEKNAWYKYMSTPFNISNATVFDNKIIVSDRSLVNRFVIDIDSKEIAQYTLPSKLFDLKTNKVLNYKIELGSQGCFHSFNEFKEYSREKNEFTLKNKSKKAFSSLPKKTNENLINEIVKEIDISRLSKITISDFEFTESDIESFKEFIIREKRKMSKNGYDRFDMDDIYQFPGENTDFDFYLRIVDKLDNISTETINSIFNTGYGNWSTTTDWRKIKVTFDDNTELVISNSDDKPNFLYLPWLIRYKGILFKSNSLRLGKLITELTKGELFDKEPLTKRYALFKIADYMYRKELKNK